MFVVYCNQVYSIHHEYSYFRVYNFFLPTSLHSAILWWLTIHLIFFLFSSILLSFERKKTNLTTMFQMITTKLSLALMCHRVSNAYFPRQCPWSTDMEEQHSCKSAWRCFSNVIFTSTQHLFSQIFLSKILGISGLTSISVCEYSRHDLAVYSVHLLGL